MLGTPCYMAPEQTLGEKNIDQRADIWSLGVVLYECLTGVRPVPGLGIGQVVMRLATEGITPLDGLVPGLPKEVAALVMRMLARERARRPQDLREVHDTLTRLTRQESLPFPRTAISQRMPVESGPPPSPGPAPIVDTQSPQAVPRRPRRAPRRSLFVCIAAGGVLATAFASWRLSAPTPVAHRTDDRVRGTVAPSAGALPTPSLSPPPLHTLAGDPPSTASSAQATEVDAAAVRTAVPAQRHPVPGHVLPPAPTDERSATPTPSGSQKAPVKATAAGGLAEKPPF
jgi:serine/threonine protein kinase